MPTFTIYEAAPEVRYIRFRHTVEAADADAALALVRDGDSEPQHLGDMGDPYFERSGFHVEAGPPLTGEADEAAWERAGASVPPFGPLDDE